MKVGDRIREAREAAGWSQARLAAAINQSQTTISSWERARTEPSRDDVARVAAALNTPLGELEPGASSTPTNSLTSAVELNGEEAPSPIYLGVGQFLSEWEMLEEALGEVFEGVVGDFEGAFAVYMAAGNSSSRRDMLLAAAAARDVDRHLLRALKQVCGAATALGTVRNNIAHGAVQIIPKRGYFLGPTESRPRKWSAATRQPRYLYTSQTLAHLTAEVGALREEASRLAVALSSGRPIRGRERV